MPAHVPSARAEITSARDWKEFAPRFGFAWQSAKRWTVRGAYCILFGADPFNEFSASPIGKWGLWRGVAHIGWGANPVQPWAGIFNSENGFPTDRYSSLSFNASYAMRTAD